MSRYFFLTGLPRCRSAWFANLLTHGPSFCYHDGFLGVDTFEDFVTKLKGTPGTRIGNSDPANVLFWERIRDAFPDATWVVIRRDFEQTYESCKRAFPSIDRAALWKMADKLSELQAELNPVEIEFDAITPNIARMVARHVGASYGDPARVEQLCRMNVQVDPAHLRREIEGLTNENFCSRFEILKEINVTS